MSDYVPKQGDQVWVDHGESRVKAVVRYASVPTSCGYSSPHVSVDYANGDRDCHVPLSIAFATSQDAVARRVAETMVKPCDAAPLDAALAPVRALVAEAMPVLNANLAAAHQEYMDGAIAKGALDYVLGRHATAARILSTDDLSFEDALQACARLTMDVRSGCSDAARPDLLNRWVDFLREAGFTDDHPLFGWPMRPGLHGNS